jgi:hypothetical protein
LAVVVVAVMYLTLMALPAGQVVVVVILGQRVLLHQGKVTLVEWVTVAAQAVAVQVQQDQMVVVLSELESAAQAVRV